MVEDNVEVGNLSTQLLQDLGYETAWAANAHEALKLIAEVDSFDVVFSNVVMPRSVGIQLGRKIQRRYPACQWSSPQVTVTSLAEEGRHGF